MADSPDEKPCQHNDASLAFARRDLGSAVQSALKLVEGSPRHVAAVSAIQRQKAEVERIREGIRRDPKCGFCVDRERAGRSPAQPAPSESA